MALAVVFVGVPVCVFGVGLELFVLCVRRGLACVCATAVGGRIGRQ